MSIIITHKGLKTYCQYYLFKLRKIVTMKIMFNIFLKVVLFFCLSAFFYSLNIGITCTNDGSHYALVKSLIENQETEIKSNVRYAGHDHAKYNGKFYSDRHPGLSIISFVAYQPLKFLTPVMAKLRLDNYMDNIKDQNDEKLLPLIMMIPSMCGAILFFLIIRFLTLFEIRGVASYSTAFIFVFMTIVLRYSTIFYSHILSTVLVLGSFILLFESGQKGGEVKFSMGIFILAWAILVEHITILLFVPLLIYFLVLKTNKVITKKSLSYVFMLSMIPASILLAYNTLNFDNPFSIAHFHHGSDFYNHSFKTMFVPTQSIVVFLHLLFSLNLTSLFMSSPILLLVFTFVPLVRMDRKLVNAELLTCLCSFLIIGFAVSSFKSPFGGYDEDYRYFLTVVPLLSPIFAVCLKKSTNFIQNKFTTKGVLIYWILLGVLVITSFLFQFNHIRHKGYVSLQAHFSNIMPAFQNFIIFGAFILILISIYLKIIRK